MNYQEQRIDLGRYMENVPAIMMKFSHIVVCSDPPLGLRKVTDIYYNPTSKRLRVILRKE